MSVFAVNFRVLQTLVAGVESARVASVVGWDNYQTSKPANELFLAAQFFATAPMRNFASQND